MSERSPIYHISSAIIVGSIFIWAMIDTGYTNYNRGYQARQEADEERNYYNGYQDGFRKAINQCHETFGVAVPGSEIPFTRDGLAMCSESGSGLWYACDSWSQ